MGPARLVIFLLELELLLVRLPPGAAPVRRATAPRSPRHHAGSAPPLPTKIRRTAPTSTSALGPAPPPFRTSAPGPPVRRAAAAKALRGLSPAAGAREGHGRGPLPRLEQAPTRPSAASRRPQQLRCRLSPRRRGLRRGRRAAAGFRAFAALLPLSGCTPAPLPARGTAVAPLRARTAACAGSPQHCLPLTPSVKLEWETRERRAVERERERRGNGTARFVRFCRTEPSRICTEY